MQSQAFWPRVTGILLISLGLAVLMGWLFRSAALLQSASAVAPVINTGACFTLCGFCMLLLGARHPTHRLRAWLGAVVSLIAALVLAQDLLYIDLGIDSVSAHDWIDDGNRRPGRMAPNTACAFLLAGWALGRVNEVRSRAVGVLMLAATFAILLLGLTGLAGYSIELDLIYSGFSGTRMALPTALGVTTIAAGLWSSWAQAPWYRSGRLFQDDQRITFVGTSLLVTIAVTTGVAGLAAQQTTLEDLLRGGQIQTFNARHSAITQELERVARNTRRVAQTPALVRDAGSRPQLISAELRAMIQDLLDAGAKSAVLSGPSGDALYSAGSPPGTMEIQARVGASPEMAMYWDGEGVAIRSRIPVGPPNAPLAMLELHEAVPLITQLLMQRMGEGETPESGLCAPRGDHNLCFPQYRNPEPYVARRLSERGLPTPTTLAIQGGTGTFKGIDYRGNSVIAAYGPIPGTELGMTVKQDTRELFAPVRARLNWAAPFLATLVILGAWLLRSQIAPLAQRLRQSEVVSRERESRLRALVNGVAEGILTFDANGTLLSANPAAVTMFDLSETALIGRSVSALLAPSSAETTSHHPSLIPTALSNEGVVAHEVTALRSSGIGFLAEVTVSRLDEGSRRESLAIVRDITARKVSEAALFAEKERLRVTLGSIGDGVITTDTDGVITYVNGVAESMTGWRLDEAVGRPLPEVLHLVHEGSGLSALNSVEFVLRHAEPAALEEDTVLIHRDGTRFPIEDSAAPIRDVAGAVIGAVLVFHDVTQARALAREMSYQASHDALTGLINRRELERQLDRSLQTARSEDRSHSLLYLDLDHFKVVNDRAGHAAGDELLRQLASRVQAQLRRSDVLARLGGDEFAVLLEDCSTEVAARLADGVVEAVNQLRFTWEDQAYDVGVSIGVVTFGHAQHSIGEVLQMADAACYGAKRAGRNQVHVYSHADAAIALQEGEMGWIARLEAAIAKGRFVLFVQEVRSLGGKPSQCELFVRLMTEDGTLIPPQSFVPAAERYGLMPAIDRWVITAALQHMASSPGCAEERWSINLCTASACELSLAEFLAEQIARFGVGAERLCFEITEAALNASQAQAPELLGRLRTMGAHITLDDFGTGVASFNAIKNLNVDMLKIDTHLITKLLTDPVDAAVVRSICQIADLAGISVGAKGVADDATLERLPSLGVDFVQGFAVGPPSPLR